MSADEALGKIRQNPRQGRLAYATRKTVCIYQRARHRFDISTIDGTDIVDRNDFIRSIFPFYDHGVGLPFVEGIDKKRVDIDENYFPASFCEGFTYERATDVAGAKHQCAFHTLAVASR